jgi:hypothetical protein
MATSSSWMLNSFARSTRLSRTCLHQACFHCFLECLAVLLTRHHPMNCTASCGRCTHRF